MRLFPKALPVTGKTLGAAHRTNHVSVKDSGASTDGTNRNKILPRGRGVQGHQLGGTARKHMASDTADGRQVCSVPYALLEPSFFPFSLPPFLSLL